MMKNTKLTDEQKTYVENNYGKGKTAVQIAKELNVPLNSIYRFAQKKKLSKKLNPVFEITNFQEQIILGGILGDGSFKKMVPIIITENVMLFLKQNILNGNSMR